MHSNGSIPNGGPSSVARLSGIRQAEFPFISEFLLKSVLRLVDVRVVKLVRLGRLRGTVLRSAPVVVAVSLGFVVITAGTSMARDRATRPSHVATTTPSPSRALPTTVHHVVAGENLTLIARRYGTDVGSLVRLNHLASPNRVSVGSSLIVPTQRPAPNVPATLARRPERLRLHGRFVYWAKRNDIPADLLMATSFLESGWNNTKVSSTGAIGIGQLMPDTSNYIMRELIGVELDPRDPDHNIRMSARYLRQLLKESGGDVEHALWRYYQGAGSIAKNGLYPQTKTYALDVMALRTRFR
jgi:N-acetylmuramoyl-L-alanine amidase